MSGERFGQLALRLLALLLLASGTAAHAQRIAIIIANQEYSSEARLSNPLRDAALIRNALGPRGARFDEVRVFTNLDLRGMKRAINSIAAYAGADALVVYYTGHGITDTARRNFLLPVDAKITRPEDIEVDGYNSEDLVQAVRDAQPKLGLIVLDACRNNPFTGAMGTRSATKGLARRGGDDLSQMLVAYAADGGQVADDGKPGMGSPYAMAFARNIATRGTPVLQMLDFVSDAVVKATRGKQRPTRDGNMRYDATLTPVDDVDDDVVVVDVPPQPQPPQPPLQKEASLAIERKLWDSCRLTRGTVPCRNYLDTFPQGQFAGTAKLLLDESTDPPEPPRVGGVRPPGPNTQVANKNKVPQPTEPPRVGGGRPPGPNTEVADKNKVPQGPEKQNTEARLTPRQLYDKAMVYRDGRPGVPQDRAEATRLFKLAADKGLAPAQFELGFLHSNGLGVPQNKAEAARLYALAAEQGHIQAQALLGFLYASGSGVTQNNAEAARLYRLAADQGHPGAQYNLGVLYENGTGVALNKQEAARLYKLAAAQNYASAQTALGYLYYIGAGVSQNKEEAARLFKLSADQGNAVGQANLASMYEKGEGGLAMDLGKAIDFYRRADASGNLVAKNALIRLGQAL